MFVSSLPSSRREFLVRASAGFGALAFNALLRLDARAALGKAPLIDPLNQLKPRAPHFAPKAKSVIFLFMVGGPSQVDTFDYKPELEKYNGKPLPESYGKVVSQFTKGDTPLLP